MNKKITIISNRNYSVKKFRKNLIKDLKEFGYEVSLIIMDDSNEKIEIDNVEINYIRNNNRSINPFSKLKLQIRFKKILKKINPDKVFTFQATPNIFGVFAAKTAGINDIYSMVEGVGDVFIENTIKWRVIRFISCILYKLSFKFTKKVFFINEDDKNEFVKRKLISNKKCIVIHGVGVDVEYYKYVPVFNTNTFIMIARMMASKGIFEYCKAAREIKKIYPDVVFNYLGEEFTIKESDIQEYVDDGSINYLGYKEDIREYISSSFVNVLPSYREGFGLVIAETGSMGRASIASNTIGCKDAVENNVSGLLFENANLQDLISKIKYALNNKEEMIRMGIQARNFAESKFNKNIINKIIIETISHE